MLAIKSTNIENTITNKINENNTVINKTIDNKIEANNQLLLSIKWITILMLRSMLTTQQSLTKLIKH